MSKKHELIKNTFVLVAGNISIQVASFLLLPFYTTHLSKSDYGVVDLITTYSFLLVPIISLQLGLASFRFLVDVRGDEKAKKSIVSNALATVSIPVFASILLFLVIARFTHTHYAYWGLATVAVAVAPSILQQFARGLGRNGVFAISGVISGVTAILLNVTLVGVYHLGARGMLVSTMVASVVASVYLVFALRLYRYIDLRIGDKSLRRELLHYSIPLLPTGISWWLMDAFDRTVITAVLGVSSNGIYAVAYKFPTAFGNLGWLFNMSWSESASLHIDKAGWNKYFSDVGNASVRFFGALVAIMIAYIGLFFNVFIGRSYQQAHNYIPILIAASFFAAIGDLYSGVYIAKKLTKKIASTAMSAAAVNVLLCIASIRLMGMYGTAFATVFAYLVMAVHRHYDTKKFVTLKYEKTVFLKVLLLYVLTTALYYYNNIILNIVSVAVVTVAAIVLNRAIVSIVKYRLYTALKKLSPNQVLSEETR